MEKITLDMLNDKGVSLKKQQYVEQNGMLYEVGQPHRKAYVNSKRGRQEVEDEIPSPYKEVIFMIWGDEPTVNEDMD